MNATDVRVIVTLALILLAAGTWALFLVHLVFSIRANRKLLRDHDRE